MKENMSQQKKNAASEEHKPERETGKAKCSVETDWVTARIGAACAEKPTAQEKNRQNHNDAMADCNSERLPNIQHASENGDEPDDDRKSETGEPADSVVK
jgi:hypothetical protein